MNATELFHSDGRSAAVYYCGKCRVVHKTQYLAEHCCSPAMCECGQPAEQYRTACVKCSRANEAKREAERFEKAEKITEWDGPVFWDGTGYNEGFFASLDDLLEHLECEDDAETSPAYVWTCNSIAFVTGIEDQILDRISDNAFEDWDTGHLSGLAELTAAISAFEDANKDQVSWEPNLKRALILPPATPCLT